MRLTDTMGMALQAIRRNTVRSLLTTLGIIIGVASVIAMVHLGQSATRSVTERISSMGSNLLFVLPGTSRFGRGGGAQAPPFDQADVDAIEREVADVLVAPAAQTSATIVYGNANETTDVIGTTNAYYRVRNRRVVSGRTFEPREIRSGAAVCVVGKTIVEDLFLREDPIGNAIRVGGTSCRVIGVLDEKGASMGRDEDDVVLMPLKAVQRRLLGRLDIPVIYVSALVDGTTARVKHDIDALLRQRRKIGPDEADDFHVRDMAEIASTLAGATATLTALLGAIAAVSLLVGGIGIMNIMLVSVTERTREIGIRLAIGARARDVLVQFLVEAIVLSTIGGLIGLGLGVAATWVTTRQLHMPFLLSPPTMLLGFSFSVIIGVVFGYVPARKAAHLNPIDALRHE